MEKCNRERERGGNPREREGDRETEESKVGR